MNKLKLLILTSICVFTFNACGGTKTAQENGMQYEIEQKLEEYKKAGWEVQGSSRTMRGLVGSMIESLRNDPQLIEITGTANNFSVISNGKQAASADAANQYAKSAAQLVEGLINNDVSLNQSLGEERDKFYAAYSTEVARLIRGELREVYTLIRKRADGKSDCEIHYLIGEPEASVVRQRAIEQAGKEIEADQDFGRKTRDYVRQKP